MQIRSAKDLIVYQKAYALAREIFEVSKSFPAEETDHGLLTEKCREVGAMLGSMINAPTSFILKASDL